MRGEGGVPWGARVHERRRRTAHSAQKAAAARRSRRSAAPTAPEGGVQWGARVPQGAAHLDEGELDEAADEDAVELEDAGLPATRTASESRPREPLLPRGGSAPMQTTDSR